MLSGSCLALCYGRRAGDCMNDTVAGDDSDDKDDAADGGDYGGE